MSSVFLKLFIFFMVETSGLEPPTFRLSGECSNQLSYVSIMAGEVGFEPTILCTKNRCLTAWPLTNKMVGSPLATYRL